MRVIRSLSFSHLRRISSVCEGYYALRPGADLGRNWIGR